MDNHSPKYYAQPEVALAEFSPQLKAFEKKISIEFIQQMRAAGTFEELSDCWDQLDVFLTSEDITSLDNHILLLHLSLASDSFRHNKNCEIGIKRMHRKEMMDLLEQLGISPEFLYQSIRVNALRRAEFRISDKDKHKSVALLRDQTLLKAAQNNQKPLPAVNLEGYAWADQELSKLEEIRASESQKFQQFTDILEGVQKDFLLAHLGQHMYEENFILKPAQLNLLARHWHNWLSYWQDCFKNADLRPQSPFEIFFKLYGERSISPELFDRLKLAFNSTISEGIHLYNNALPLDIINPNSGWFFVCIKNLKAPITFNKFKQAVLGDMADWYLENLTNANPQLD